MSKHSSGGGRTIAEKLGLGPEVRELKLGASFTNNKAAFHTIRYDFKPASVDETKNAVVDVGSNNQITVTVPHLDGAATPYTVYKGSQRPSKKECVLIIDKVTGECTLEKLSTNIQVKKTRFEPSQKIFQPIPTSSAPVDLKSSNSSKKPAVSHSSKNKKTFQSSKLIPSLSGSIPKHSPLHASPSYPSSRSPVRSQHKSSPQNKSPPEHKSPPSLVPSAGSLPALGLDDFGSSRNVQHDIVGNFRNPQQESSKSSRSYQDTKNKTSPDHPRSAEKEVISNKNVSTLSDSSSDSSSESESSDSNSDSEASNRSAKNPTRVNGCANGMPLSMPDELLKEDLQLSESDMDTD